MSRPTAIVIGVGAEHGLGAALSRRFAAEGHHVLVAGRTPHRIEQVVRAIAEAGGSAEAVPTDTTREEEVGTLFDVTEDAGSYQQIAAMANGLFQTVNVPVAAVRPAARAGFAQPAPAARVAARHIAPRRTQAGRRGVRRGRALHERGSPTAGRTRGEQIADEGAPVHRSDALDARGDLLEVGLT